MVHDAYDESHGADDAGDADADNTYSQNNNEENDTDDDDYDDDDDGNNNN